MEKSVFYDGPEPMEYLYDVLDSWADEVLLKIKRNESRCMTGFEEQQHEMSTFCYLCRRSYTETNPKSKKKVRF